MSEVENYFKELSSIDLSNKIKKKNGNPYMPWASSWSALKEKYPDSTYKVYEQTFTIATNNENGSTRTEYGRPWFDDGKTGWVKVGVVVNGIEHIEPYAIKDLRNKAISAENITSVEANIAFQRAITKACARHGVAAWIYEGDDLPMEIKEIMKLQSELMDIINKKAALSSEAKEKVMKLCKDADVEANGDPRLIEDLDTLKTLKKSLLAIRK